MNAFADTPAAAADLRSRILAEATRLFASRGYQAASVREVVEAAGCTKPALYYYFQNKEALFLEALRDATEHMTQHIEGTRELEGSTRAQLEHGIRTFFESLAAQTDRMRLIMRAELQPDVGQPGFDFESVRASHFRAIEEILAAGVRKGEIRADVDLTDAAYAIAGMVDQRLRLWMLGEAPPRDLTERILRIFFDGVS